MPALEKVYQDYHASGLEILAVNNTAQDDPQKALKFAKRLDLTFPILFDSDASVGNLYQVRALPTTFFIDAQGIIHDVVVGGPMSEALLRVRVQELMSLAAGEQD
jgi:peroxiredoxin